MSGTSFAVDSSVLAEVSIDGVAITDAGEVVQANDALAGVHGTDGPEEIVGREWERLYTPVGERTAAELLEAVREDGEWRGRASATREDGADVPVELSLCSTDDCLVCVVSERPGTDPPERVPRAVTERERDERLERYETVVETVDDGVYVLDDDLRVDMANERFFEMLAQFGISREEALDIHAHDMIPREEDRVSLERAIDGAIEDEPHTGSFEMLAETPEGETVVCESRFRLYPEPQGEHRGCIGILRDITERKERERELRTARQFNEELVENAPFCMVRIDEEFRITYVNPRTEEVTGLPEGKESEALGIDIRELPSVAETGEAHRFTPLQDGETIEFEFPFESLYGREVYFTGRGVPLLSDGEFEGAVLMSVDISERHQHEKDLKRQRNELDTLNRINELLLAVARDLFESPMDDDIEETVCSRLAGSDLYQFAWIGKPEAGGDRLVPDVHAGVDGALLASVSATTAAADTAQEPATRAFRTGEIQVTQNLATDPAFEAWREAARDHDSRSAAAVPVTYDGSTYGVLAVYSSRPLAFSRREQRGFEILGEAVGYAINANRTRRLLFAEHVTELEFGLSGVDEFAAGATDRLDCALSLEGYVSTGDGTWVLCLSLAGTRAEQCAETLREDPDVRVVRTIGDGPEQTVMVTVESSLLDVVAALGGRVTAATVENGDATVQIEVPQAVDVSGVVERVRTLAPGTDLLAKRDRERPVEGSTWLSGEVSVDLTDRQRQALDAAYLAGYFDWPRESTAEDVADLLDVSRPTFQAHLRKAERELLDTFVGERGREEGAVE